MSSAAAPSLLESLPPELFNYVLSYVLEPIDNTETPTQFRSYRFDTALMRINKAIHALAKSYLHHSISWARIDVNWDAFLIDPHWIGVPYITIERVDSKKSIPLPYAGDCTRRAVKQDVPKGRIHARIIYPSPQTEYQKRIKKLCFHSPFLPSMSLLIRAEDLRTFLRVVRMNDLAYCNRAPPIKQPLASLQMAVKNYGISFDIRVIPGYQVARYEALVDMFKGFTGPYHEGMITGHDDESQAQDVIRQIQLSRRVVKGQLHQQDHQSRTYLEAVSHILYLKTLGDKYLQMGFHFNAYVCYSNALELEKYWSSHDPAPSESTFWSRNSNTFKAVGTALALNMCIAHVTGHLRLAETFPRNNVMLRHAEDLWNTISHEEIGALQQQSELLFIAYLYHIFTAKAINMPERLLMFMETWPVQPANTHGQSTRGKLWNMVKALSDDIAGLPISIERLGSIPERVDDMRQVARELKLKHVKWAIHEKTFPKGLTSRLPFVPKAGIRDGGRCYGTEKVSFLFPEFCKPTDEARISGEQGFRYLL